MYTCKKKKKKKKERKEKKINYNFLVLDKGTHLDSLETVPLKSAVGSTSSLAYNILLMKRLSKTKSPVFCFFACVCLRGIIFKDYLTNDNCHVVAINVFFTTPFGKSADRSFTYA